MTLPINTIIDLYNKGLPDERIATMYGVSRRTIGNLRQKHGITTRIRGSWMKGKKRPKHSQFMKQYAATHIHPMKGKKLSANALANMMAVKNTPEYKAKIYTPERNAKISKATMGQKHHAWKGGPKTPKQEKNYLRKRANYKKWRKAVFVRDDYRCKKCEIRGGYLEAHHIASFDDYPKLRYLLINGLTLCLACHKDVHIEQRHRKIS